MQSYNLRLGELVEVPRVNAQVSLAGKTRL